MQMIFVLQYLIKIANKRETPVHLYSINVCLGRYTPNNTIRTRKERGAQTAKDEMNRKKHRADAICMYLDWPEME